MTRSQYSLQKLVGLAPIPGREKLFIHPKLVRLLSDDAHEFEPYP